MHKKNITAKSASLTLSVLLGGMAFQANAAPCNAAPVQNLIGTTATYNAVNNAVQTAGASIVRVVEAANLIITKDKNDNRLTIFTDSSNKITSLSCY